MKKQTTALRRRSFERIVVLVDIRVVLLQHEPKKLFAAHVFNSVSRILQQCNKHSNSTTLWGYKFFDPGHNPFASRSKIAEYLGGTQMSEQFDAGDSNLMKFGKILDQMVNNIREYSSGGGIRGDYVARAINDVICDYTWEPLLASDSSSSDEELLASKERLGGDGAKCDSNAIILFSSVPTTWTSANFFFNVEPAGDIPPDPYAQGILGKVFRTVREALKSRNIQVCFVDVPMHQEFWSNERLEAVLQPTAARSLMLKTLHYFVRRVITSDLLDGNILPCNLIWNTMADLGIRKSRNNSHARIRCSQDTLLCEVQLQPFNATPSTSRGTSVSRTMLIPATDTLDIVLKSAQPRTSFSMKLPSKRFLVRQNICPKTSLLDEDTNSFGDKILELLDQRAFRPGQPGWQLLLLTLATRESVCEVSLRTGENRPSLRALLEPFTSHCAILSVFEKEIIPTETDSMDHLKTETKESVHGKDENGTKRRTKHDGVMVIPSGKRRKVVASVEPVINWQEYWEREGTISAPIELTSDGGTVISRYIAGGKASRSLQTVDSLLKERPQPNRGPEPPLHLIAPGAEPSADQAANNDGFTLTSIAQSENSYATALDLIQSKVGLTVEGGCAILQKGSNAVVDVETPAQEADRKIVSEEAKEYIASVGQKIEDYLTTSTDVDSQRFAGMLLAQSHRNLCILTTLTDHQLDDHQRLDTGESAELELNKKIAVNLKKLLLKSSKRLLAKYKNCEGCPSEASSSASVDEKVKEYELQILFRLEMIACDDGRLLEQTAKDQLVKDVCKLLHSIRFHLPGGIFGGKNFLTYCDRLLVSRYNKQIPSTISKIYMEMELDGHSVFPPPSSAQDVLQESSLKAPTDTGDLLLREAGVSNDSISCSDRISNSASGPVPSSSCDPEYAALRSTLNRNSSRKTSREDSKGEGELCFVDKGSKKKGSYHFASHGPPLVRTRKFRSDGRRMSHSKHSKGLSRPNVPIIDDPVQIVCQTPAPMTFSSSPLGEDLSRRATLAPPKELIGCSHKNERVNVAHPPNVVEGTPVARRKLTLPSVPQENTTATEMNLNEMVADIDRTSDAVPNLSAGFPSKMSLASVVPERCRRSVPSGGSSGKNQDVVSFSELLQKMTPRPPRTEVEKLESHLGGHVCRSKDEEGDDDDEDGIISTPFKVNISGQSLTSLHSSQSDRHNCYRRLELVVIEHRASLS